MQFFFSETKTEGIALIKESKFAYINVLITKYVTKMLAMRVKRIMELTSLKKKKKKKNGNHLNLT